MNAWLIGGGIYVATSLIALALCRVASPINEDDIQTCAGATKLPEFGTEFEQLIGYGGDRTDAVVHRKRDHDQSHELPGSRPSVRSQRPSDLPEISRWPQASPRPDISTVPPPLHAS